MSNFYLVSLLHITYVIFYPNVGLLRTVLAGGGPDVQCKSSHSATRVRLELDIESVAVRRKHLTTLRKVSCKNHTSWNYLRKITQEAHMKF